MLVVLLRPHFREKKFLAFIRPGSRKWKSGTRDSGHQSLKFEAVGCFNVGGDQGREGDRSVRCKPALNALEADRGSNGQPVYAPKLL
jgi:hypothetical protein